jgi:acetyl-CoA acyltransferase
MSTTGPLPGGADRIAVVAGLRTPFTKAGTALKSLRTVDLGATVVKELVARSELSPLEITLCVYGQVVPSLDWLNIAREVVLRAGLPKTTDAFSVSRACATSIQALTTAAEAMLGGQHDVAIVGGADSMSDVPLGVSRRLAAALVQAQKAKSIGDKIKAFSKLSLRAISCPPCRASRASPPPESRWARPPRRWPREPHLPRGAGPIAHASHVNAARAWADGTYAAEVMHVIPPPFDKAVGEGQPGARRLDAGGLCQAPSRLRSQARDDHRRQRLARSPTGRARCS